MKLITCGLIFLALRLSIGECESLLFIRSKNSGWYHAAWKSCHFRLLVFPLLDCQHGGHDSNLSRPLKMLLQFYSYHFFISIPLWVRDDDPKFVNMLHLSIFSQICFYYQDGKQLPAETPEQTSSRNEHQRLYHKYWFLRKLYRFIIAPSNFCRWTTKIKFQLEWWGRSSHCSQHQGF